MKRIFLKGLVFGTAAFTLQAADFSQFVNNGLVGVGRLPANSFDQLGNNVDTLGGIFSSLSVDLSSVKKVGNTYSGTLFGLPDRGFGDGAQDYHPRIQTLDFSITPYTGAGVVPQTQITLRNTATLILKDAAGNPFTGFNPGSVNTTSPQSPAASLGQGHFSLDPEGLVRLPGNAGWLVSDEYGPNIYKFDNSGVFQSQLTIPANFIPKQGSTVNFDGNINPTSGRRGNRGMEGLTLAPDGKTLFAALQSPLVQDGGLNNNRLYTRILRYDLGSGNMTGEFVYKLSNKADGNGRGTPISEILALNDHQLLVLERDGIGLGGSNGGANYKNVNLADINNASNLLDAGFADFVKSADEPGAKFLSDTTVGAGKTIAAVDKVDFVNILDKAQLDKYGLTKSSARTQNSLSEKWEGLGLIPVEGSPNEFLLLVGNDNDFKSSTVYHNGQIVGNNDPTLDTMILAYSLTLPGVSLTPVPEAGTIWGAFALSGLAGLALLRRRA